MKNNNRIRIVGLIALSVLVVIGTFAVVLILAVDAKTIPEKIQATLALGIPSSITLIVLLWLGAGVDGLLARIQNRSRRVLVSLGVYIIAPGTLCIGLPALLILLFTGSLFPQKGWQALPAPPERPTEVVAAGESSVIILTESGQHYYCWIATPNDCWSETTEPESPIIKSNTYYLEQTTTLPSSDPPQQTENTLSIYYTDKGTRVRIHYAVLEDGSVWYLEEGGQNYETGFAVGLFATLAIIPAISGLLVTYLGAGVSAVLRWFTNRTYKEN